MTVISSSLKPFVINSTDIQFLVDQLNFVPLYDASGKIIVAWDGTGPVYNFSHVQYVDQGSAAANLAKWGQSYQTFTDLAGTRDVSGYWNNLTAILAHYGDTGQVFPRMVTADYSGYIAQMTGTATTGPIIVTSVNPVVTIAETNIQNLFDSGVYNVFSAPGVSKMLHEIVTSGTTVTTAIAETIAAFVVDGHHLTPTVTTTTTSTTTTTTSSDFLKDEVTTTLTTLYGSTQTVNATVVQTSAPMVSTIVGAGNAVTTLSGGELDGAYHGFTTAYALAHQDYTVQAAIGGGVEGDTTSSDGTAINLKNVVDYTPRMISRAVTTAGVTYDTWANHQTMDDGNGGTIANPDAAHHTANEIYYNPTTGEAVLLEWGALETVANGGEGQVDPQARLAASAGQDDHFIGGLNPGVSGSNGFFVLFGQFFDHGLDFIDKGQLDSSGKNITIKIALALDDPLYGMYGPDGQPVTEITINRATVQTVDASGSEYVNHVSPFIDQSQTYGSDAQRTQLLREWVSTDGNSSFHAGMKLLDGTTLQTAWAKPDGTMTYDTLPTLNELRAHIDATGRDALTWEDVSNLRARDAAGHVVAGSSGEALLLDMNPRFDEAHLLTAQGENALEVGKVNAAITLLDATVKTLFGATSYFHIDATTHKLTLFMEQLPPGTPPGTPQTLAGANAMYPFVNFANFSINASLSAADHTAVSDLLMASVGDHYIAGDGRVNENFGLTSIHHVFHEEHNFQVQNLIDALHRQDIATHDVTHDKLHEFQIDTGHTNAAGDYIYSDNSIAWNEDKVFQGAKLIVEMEYQHAAVDQYARNVSPNIQEFVGYSPDKMPDVSLEYSQVAFRFGHSTLRETIDTIDPTHGLTGKIMGYALHDAFLNPELFGEVGPGSILLGMTHQQMSEVDEFITPALNQGLLGQPLDLAAINIARGRDIGIPTLNDFRAAIDLARYTSWNDFGQNMQHPSSLVNFIAAYAFDGAVNKAQAVFDLVTHTYIDDVAGVALGAVLDWAGTISELVSQASAFMSGDATKGGAGTLGFNLIDTWLGGLAEIHQPGGILGETFDKIFVTQIEALMDGDRFYYLYRLAGQQFGEEVANGQLKDLVERNTGLVHLNGNVFGYADQYVDLGANKEVTAPGAEALTTGNEHKYGDIAEVAAGTIGVYSNGGLSNVQDGQLITINGHTYIQDTRLSADNPLSADYDPTGQSGYAQNGFTNLDGTPNTGAESNEVIVGTKGNDLIYSQGGDDTTYGEEGDDIIYGGYGIDRLYGGAGKDVLYGGDNPDLMDGGSGDDIIYGDSSGTDINGADQLIGGSGNDIIYGGTGIDKLSAGSGDDQVYGGQDTDPFTHGGDGNDLVSGDSGGDILYGDNGDDIVVGGADQDQLFGNDGDDILRPGDPTGALTIGSDEVLGGDGVDANDKGFDLIDFSDNNARQNGVTFDIGNQANPSTAINGSAIQVPSYQIDGVVGSVSDDKLLGNSESAAGIGADASIAGNNWLIGGSGNDTFQGLGGNDIIIGGSIRLDALIGKYNTAYDHNNGNAGLTDAEQLLDAQYQGASHRVLYSDTIDGTGLIDAINALDTTGGSQSFDKHFIEMLRTELFKDTVLGDGDGAVAGQGADAGTADIAIYTGNKAQYKIEGLTLNGHNVVKITDLRTAADFVDGNGQAILDANGNPLTNEGTDMLLGVETARFADQDFSITFTPPTLDLHGFSVLGTLADTFDGTNSNNSNNRVLSPSNNSTGTIGWTTSWTEADDVVSGNGNTNNIRTGQIQIDGGGGNGTDQLRIYDNGDGASIQRAVNFGAATGATLSFGYSENSFDNGETVVASFSFNGGTSWHTLLTMNANTGNGGTYTQDLTALLGVGESLGANGILKFEASTTNGGNGYIAIDNVSISELTTANDGLNWAAAYSEGGDRTPISSNSTVVDDSATMASAKIVLTNAVAGDLLRVGTSNNTSGNFGGGVSYSVNSSVAGQITLTITGVASKSAYQGYIDQVRFYSTSDDPTAQGTNTERFVNVTVNDGFSTSNVATTTIAVTGINDVPNANNDVILTNIQGTGAVLIPDWVLLANDTDPDGPLLAVSGVSGANSATASRASGTVTFVDTGSSATNNSGNAQGTMGSFNYAVTDNAAPTQGTDTASVTVSRNSDASGNINGNNSSTGDIIIGDGRSSTIDAGTGNDVVLAGDGNDNIVWNATGTVSVTTNRGQPSTNVNVTTDGHDFIDGGAGTDTFTVTSSVIGTGSNPANTNAAQNHAEVAEDFKVYTRAAAGTLFGVLNAATEIVVTRNGVVIAELANVEELVINTGAGNDTVQIIGNFNPTHLAYNTIHINDSDGGDTVDITQLTSAHRIVFNTDAAGQVIGELRPQDVVIGGSHGTSNSPPVGDNPNTDGGSSGDDSQTASDAEHGTSSDADFGNDDDDASIPVTAADTTTTYHSGLTLTGDGAANTLIGSDANDLMFGGDGADNIVGGDGRDMLFGDGGNDRIFGGEGHDVIDGGSGDDLVFAGDGNDLIIASNGDGSDTYWGEAGTDTLDYAAVSANIEVDLGSGLLGRGQVVIGSETDTIYGFENVITGSGNDRIIANASVNALDGGTGNDTFVFGSAEAADGDTIYNFSPGDIIDLSGIDADQGATGHQSFVLFTTGSFSAAGQLMVNYETREDGDHTIISGNVNDDAEADFSIDLVGRHLLTGSDFSGVN